MERSLELADKGQPVEAYRQRGCIPGLIDANFSICISHDRIQIGSASLSRRWRWPAGPFENREIQFREMLDDPAEVEWGRH